VTEGEGGVETWTIGQPENPRPLPRFPAYGPTFCPRLAFSPTESAPTQCDLPGAWTTLRRSTCIRLHRPSWATPTGTTWNGAASATFPFPKGVDALTAELREDADPTRRAPGAAICSGLARHHCPSASECASPVAGSTRSGRTSPSGYAESPSASAVPPSLPGTPLVDGAPKRAEKCGTVANQRPRASSGTAAPTAGCAYRSWPKSPSAGFAKSRSSECGPCRCRPQWITSSPSPRVALSWIEPTCGPLTSAATPAEITDRSRNDTRSCRNDAPQEARAAHADRPPTVGNPAGPTPTGHHHGPDRSRGQAGPGSSARQPAPPHHRRHRRSAGAQVQEHRR
jgi:hypothetical protein